MKKFFLCMAVALVAVCASAQTTWNVRAGGGVEFTFDETYYGDGDDSWGTLALAVEANIPFHTTSLFTFSPSLILQIPPMDDVDVYALTIPLHFGYKLPIGDKALFFPKIGPIVGIGIGGYHNYIIGPSAELAIEGRHYVLSLNAYHSLARSSYGRGVGSAILLSLGYKF
ncbi:MAG: outer membrane beta-barrel protein [Bacteroides sp.]|nr:outer membrane beta-barrel protein [Bacteroides sp.]